MRGRRCERKNSEQLLKLSEIEERWEHERGRGRGKRKERKRWERLGGEVRERSERAIRSVAGSG